ncbi:MAG: hypothetical protein FJ006_06035 [Chloroflexi bacterium]|nr:hypothetical protein [Chloroflexota bacterium]
MRQVTFFKVRLGASQEADERALNAFIAEVKIRKIVPVLVQDALPNFWSVYVEYERSKQELESKKEGKVISKSYSLESIRRQYPRAYENWTDDEDIHLKIEYGKGMSIQLLSERFQRQPSAIRSRLQKLELWHSNLGRKGAK